MGMMRQLATSSVEEEQRLGREMREYLVEDLGRKSQEANGAIFGEVVAGVI